MSILLTIFFLFISCSTSSPSLPQHFSHRPTSSQNPPQEFIDPTYPLPNLPNPKCTQLILTHSFANTYNLPPTTAPYSPPTTSKCSAPWSHLILTLSVSSHGDQYDRIAAIWLGGVEVLRTSTAEPTESGIFWTVKKDVTKYHSLFMHPQNLTMMLENIVNDEFTGIYHCNVTLELYPVIDSVYVGRRMSREVLIGNSDNGADLILPVSNESDENGYWFRIGNKGSDLHSRNVVIPMNAYRAVLEVYVSFHGNDEFWYSNPPNEYIETNNLTTGRGNGASRTVFPTIDGQLVGSIVPFPVIFTGGINPLFWAPIVGIGAFNLPTYDVDITPFLGLLLDGKPHEFGLNVSDGISFWLVDANLHLWLDSELTTVEAKLIEYVAPQPSILRTSNFFHLNGTFSVDVGMNYHFSGWVNSSLGHLTTAIRHEVKSKNRIVFSNDGNYKEVHMKVKMKDSKTVSDAKGLLLSQTAHKYKHPLTIITESLPQTNNTFKMNTKLSNALYQESYCLHGDKVILSKIHSAKQDADGWMLVQDHSVLVGTGGTQNVYKYNVGGSCYTRQISAKDGTITNDIQTTVCPSLQSSLRL